MLLQWPEEILPPEMIARIEDACAKGNAAMHINGIDPGFANDVLPLVMTSLSQRIDEVRVMEICDYSTYYQPVVMNDMFGFGKPMDEVGMIFQPGILTMAWGSVVRQIAAGLDVTLDEPLTEEVDRRAAEWDTESVSGDVQEGTMGAVKFAVVGKVDGVPRVVLEHITRTDPEQVPEWEKPPEGSDGCYRIKITGEPMMNVDFTHHGEHGDHNVSGMITTAQRIINALPAVVAAEPGHRPRDRPAAGHRPRAGAAASEHPRPVRRHRTRSRSSPAPAAASAPPPPSRSPRRAPTSLISARTADQLEEVAEQIRATGRRAVVVAADLSDLDAVAGLAQTAYDEFGRLDTVVNNVGGTFPRGFLDTSRGSSPRRSASTSPPRTRSPGRRCR